MTPKELCKQYVVKTASVTKPYKGKWSASVTLGMDVNELGATIEEAYCKLVDRIMGSSFLKATFEKLI